MLEMDQEKANLFARTNFRGDDTPFGIKPTDRQRHMYVIGKTGTGKTNMIKNMAIHDIRAGHGMAFIDPHGDTADDLLNFIPSSRVNDVIYFNPADQDHPIALNAVEQVDPDHRHLVASGLVGVFKKLWAESWGPRLEYLLRNAILALLEYPGATLLGVMRILVDKSYRKKVIEKIQDPVVKSFWVEEFVKYPDRFAAEAVAPIQNKVGQFLSNPLIRNIVGQTKTSFDIREVMDSGKILIMNVSKGAIGEDTSALLGAMMITKLQLAAMSRVDIPEDDRRDFYLYVDEFQNFATESFATILSEARKYHLSLILAHQYIAQMPDIVRDAVFGNVGTLVSFRIGAFDAEYLEKEFEPVFTMNDLVNLDKYHIYLKLMIDGMASQPFSAETLVPLEPEIDSNMEKIIKVSRERYANKKEVIEEKISKWSGVHKIEQRIQAMNENDRKEEEAIASGKPNPGFKSATAAPHKELFDATCSRCKEETQVPFKPDGARPVYCRECLADVKEKKEQEAEAPRAPEVAPREPAVEPKPFQKPKKEVDYASLKELIIDAKADDSKGIKE